MDINNQQEMSLVNLNTDDKSLTIKAMPFWRGIHKNPVIPLQRDFILGCNPLGFLQQKNTNFLDEVIAGYSQNDYNFITSPPGTSEWANILVEKDSSFLCKFIDFARIKNVVEIGAGSFFLANALVKEYGILNYTILDPSIRESNSNPIINLKREYFVDARQIDTRPDLIISINCLEHLSDPFSFLSEIQKSLDPVTGIAFLSFPDVEYQLMSGDFNGLLHEHINYFTFDTAKTLMEKAGFEIVESERRDDSLRFIVKPGKIIARSQQETLEQFLVNTGKKLIDSIEWAKRQIEESLSRGEKVAIHGACNGTFNFLYVTNLYQEKNISIFDTDELKHGKFMTSLEKPIFHALHSSYKEIDQVYVGAMTFFNEIKQFLMKNHGFSEDMIHPLFPR